MGLSKIFYFSWLYCNNFAYGKGVFIINAITINSLSYTYPGNILAINDVTLSISKGKKIALLGSNGSGKSTLLHHLNGLKIPQKGSIEIMGKKITKDNVSAIKKTVGIVFDNPEDQLFSTTVFDDVSFGPRNLGYSQANLSKYVVKAISAVGVDDLQNRSPHGLSLGQMKRVAIAGVLAMNPDIILLDEPFSGLDPHSLRQLLIILEDLHRLGHTLIITTHNVDLVYEWADECVIMKEGRILSQGPVELLEDSELMIEAKLGLPSLYSVFKSTSSKPKSIQEAKKLVDQLLK